jgi:hypothetical protein
MPCTTVLKTPHKANYRWTDAERRRAVVYIKEVYQLTASAQAIEKELPRSVP